MFQFNQIDDNIQTALFNRIDALNREKTFSPLEPQTSKQSSMDAMLTKSVWASVTSAVYDSDKNNNLIKDKLLRITSGIDENDQPINAPITTMDSFGRFKTGDLGPKSGDVHRGHSGITSISTSFKSHSIQYVTINWKFWDIRDFEKYKEAFLKHGRVVLVEFGWASNNMITIEKQTTKDPSDLLSIFRSTEKQIKGAGGDYYCAMGKIKNYDYKINTNGGFDCTTELVSMGSSLFKGQIDPVTEKKVPEIIAENNSDKTSEALKSSNFYFEKYMENLDDNLKRAAKKGVQGVYHDDEKGWCNWAYFEDIILGTFFGWTTEEGTTTTPDLEDIKLKNNSLTTKILSADIEFKIDKNSKITDTTFGPNTCRNSDDLFTNGKHIILPGQTVGIVPNDGKSFSGDTGEKMNEQFKGSETMAEYLKLFKTLKEINENMPPFKLDGSSKEITVEQVVKNEETGELEIKKENQTIKYDKGIIRHFVFSSDFLKNSFGGGVVDLGAAMGTHWSSVSSQYGGYWDFNVVNSANDNGQIGIIDRHSTEFRVENVNPEGVFGSKSKRVNGTTDGYGTFVFSNYGKNSLIKDFNVEVKLSAAQATMAMYHSNKNPESTDGGTNKPEDIGVAALGELQNVQITPPVSGSDQGGKGDVVIQNITYPFLQNKMMSYKNPAKQSDGLVEGGVVVDEEREPFGDKSIIEVSAELDKQAVSEEKAEAGEAYMSYKEDNPENAGLIFTPDGTIIPGYDRYMLYLLNKSPKAQKQIDPLVPLSVSFSMPGIGGISLYDIFAIDYLPEVYKLYSVFQATAVDHQVDSSGWTTSITGQMRIDMIKLVGDKGNLIKPKVKVVKGDVNTSLNFVDLYIDSNKDKSKRKK